MFLTTKLVSEFRDRTRKSERIISSSKKKAASVPTTAPRQIEIYRVRPRARCTPAVHRSSGARQRPRPRVRAAAKSVFGFSPPRFSCPVGVFNLVFYIMSPRGHGPRPFGPQKLLPAGSGPAMTTREWEGGGAQRAVSRNFRPCARYPY